MNKVAFIIPSMNRPELLFRQFEFYELLNSPHPIYISDSSNPENTKKIQEGIKKFKKLNITYQWVPAGKDNTYQLHPLIKEKYCMIISDDDLVNPDTITECADFLESHPDYTTCSGWQVSFNFGSEDFDKPYGKIVRQTVPYGRAVEEESMIARIKSGLFNPTTPFVCFSVRSMETEKMFRKVSRHFSLMEDMYEFSLIFILLSLGKYKIIDRIGYFMQRSVVRFPDHKLSENPLQSPHISEYSKIFEEGFADTILTLKEVKSREEAIKIARWTLLIYLASFYSLESGGIPSGQEKFFKTINSHRLSYAKKIKPMLASLPFVKRAYYKFKPPKYIDQPESKYYKDFKIFKDFIEKDR